MEEMRRKKLYFDEKRNERLEKHLQLDLEKYDQEIDKGDTQGKDNPKEVDKNSSEYQRAKKLAEKLKVNNNDNVKVSKNQAVEIMSTRPSEMPMLIKQHAQALIKQGEAHLPPPEDD